MCVEGREGEREGGRKERVRKKIQGHTNIRDVSQLTANQLSSSDHGCQLTRKHLNALLFIHYRNTSILNSVHGKIIFRLEIIMGNFTDRKILFPRFQLFFFTKIFHQNSSKNERPPYYNRLD